MKCPVGKAILRSDYTPYPWEVTSLKLKFEIGDEETLVSSEIRMKLKPGMDADCPIELDGQDMTLRSIQLNGSALSPELYSLDDDRLVIHNAPAECRLDIQNAIRPQENTALEGLYPSGAFLLTQ